MKNEMIIENEKNKPFVFISYSHMDSDIVLQAIKEFRKNLYEIWYDDRIAPGTEWDKIVAEHVEKCGYFIAFISKNYINSSNCKDELNFARDLEKKRFLVYIEEVELPSEMKMRLSRIQNIHKYKYDNDKDFYNKLFSADGLDKFKATERKEYADFDEFLENDINLVGKTKQKIINEPGFNSEKKSDFESSGKSKLNIFSLVKKLSAKKMTNKRIKDDLTDNSASVSDSFVMYDKQVNNIKNRNFENFEDVLSSIFSCYGTDIIYDYDKLMQLIQVYAQSFTSENRLLKLALELGVYDKLKNVDKTNAEEQNSVYKQVVDTLCDNGIDKSCAENVLSWYIKHLNWKPDIAIGKKLFFGNYPFEENGDKQKIEWDIIDIKDGKALLLSTYCIDAHDYDDNSCNWQYSELKRWLGAEFRNIAFTYNEEKIIASVNNKPSSNPISGVIGGISTTDKIFVLSLEQIRDCQLNGDLLKSEATPYAKENGVLCDKENKAYWWLRTPGIEENTEVIVNKNGKIIESGSFVYLPHRGVRPALWITIDEFNRENMY